MRQATGEFLAFLDSDDKLPRDALLHLLSRIDDTVDVAVGRMRTFPVPDELGLAHELKEARTIDSLAEAPTLIHSASVCNKLFRSSFIRDLGLRFAEGVHFEDVYFTVPALLRARRIVLVDKLVYEYRKRDAGGSIMDSLFTREKNYWDHLLADGVPAAPAPGSHRR